MPRVEKELGLDLKEEMLPGKDDKQRFQAITGSVMYLGQVVCYGIQYAVQQLAREVSKPSNAHISPAINLFRYLAGTTDFVTTYKQGGFKLSAFSDDNWGNEPDNGKPMLSYVVMLFEHSDRHECGAARANSAAHHGAGPRCCTSNNE